MLDEKEEITALPFWQAVLAVIVITVSTSLVVALVTHIIRDIFAR